MIEIPICLDSARVAIDAMEKRLKASIQEQREAMDEADRLRALLVELRDKINEQEGTK